MAARRRRRQPLAFLPRAGAAAGRLSRTSRLHPCGVLAGDGPSVFRLLGLSNHRLLRAIGKFRHAAGLDVSDRHAASTRHRRHPRLGAVALPQRRAWPRLLRRHPSLRACRPAPGLSSRLEELYFQLRAARGAELSDQQRAVLARQISHRRFARRRGRLHALSRLRAASMASGFPINTAAGRISRPSIFCAA